MFALPAFIAFALVTPPTAQTHARSSMPRAPETCVAPTQTGTFRLTAVRTDGKDRRPVMVILENLNGCLEATFVTDESLPAVIDHLDFSGSTLKGALRVAGKPAKLTLTFDGGTVSGSIVDGSQAWQVEGRRTG